MKKQHLCPKCNAQDIICIPGHAGAYGSGNNIPMGYTIFTAVKVTRYICGFCGYSEEWIESLEDLKKLRDKYGNGNHSSA